jgi:[protein-PII] uridylyltransferase
MMQRYYQTAKGVTQLNTILMQNLEALLAPRPDTPPRALNERFEVRSELLHIKREDTFKRQPTAILESFLMMMQHQELRGMTARTLRALWRARPLINSAFRKDPVAQLLFLQILQQPRGIVHEFRRMNQYGVLGLYLPEFGAIVGQMQHDLFHVYTVDQHILMVLRNLRRFTMPEFAHEFPLCTELMSGFERSWLLYVAALYHDIAKGRGGDHLDAWRRGREAIREKAWPRHGGPRAGRVPGRQAPRHVARRAEAGRARPGRGARVRRDGSRRAPPHRALPLHRCRCARHQPEGLERVEGEAARGPVPRCSAGADRPAARARRGAGEKQAEAVRCCGLYALDESVKDKLWSQLDTTYFLRHDAQEIAWQTATSTEGRCDKPVVKARSRLSARGCRS